MRVLKEDVKRAREEAQEYPLVTTREYSDDPHSDPEQVVDPQQAGDELRFQVKFAVPAPVKAAFEEVLDLHRAACGYEETVTSFVEALVAEVEDQPKIMVHTSSTTSRIEGGPGLFDVTLASANGAGDGEVKFRVGAVVQATGWTPVEIRTAYRISTTRISWTSTVCTITRPTAGYSCTVTYLSKNTWSSWTGRTWETQPGPVWIPRPPLSRGGESHGVSRSLFPPMAGVIQPDRGHT